MNNNKLALKISCFIVIMFTKNKHPTNEPCKQAKKSCHFSANLCMCATWKLQFGFELACIWHKSKTVKTDCYFVSICSMCVFGKLKHKRGTVEKETYHKKLQLLIGRNSHEMFAYINHFNVELWHKVMLLFCCCVVVDALVGGGQHQCQTSNDWTNLT